MVAESSQIALLCRIDEDIFFKGHEVEMLDTFLVVLVPPTLEIPDIDDIADVFENESIRLDLMIRSETIAFLLCFEDRDFGMLMFLEPLVLAI